MDVDELALIKKRAVRGVVALTSRTFIDYLFRFFSRAFLSFFLLPADFGIYVAVTAIMRITSFITDFGFGAAIVQQKEEVTNDDLKTAFTIQFFLTLSIFLFFLIMQNYIGLIFHLGKDGRILLLTLIFTIFLSSFKTIPSVIMERSLKFEKIIIPQLIESFVFNILLVLLAYNKFGVASYTWSTLVSSVVSIPIYYRISHWKPAFGVSQNSLRMLKYGVKFQAKGVLGTIKDDLLTTFLALILPISQLGLIGWAQGWAFFSYRFFVDSITKVSFSAYSRLQKDSTTLRIAIEKSLFVVSFFTFPISIGLILTAAHILNLVPRLMKWEPAVFSLSFFALNAAISSLSGILVNTLDATGHVGKTLKLMIMWTSLTWILTPIAVYFFGFNGIAPVSFLITLSIGITVHLVKKIVTFNFFGSFYKPLLGSIFMGIVVFVYDKTAVANLINLAGSVLLGVICYSLFMYFSCKEIIFEYITVFKNRK